MRGVAASRTGNIAYRALALAATSLAVAGCGAISIPLGDLMSGNRPAQGELTTGSVPAERVPATPLPPVITQASTQASAPAAAPSQPLLAEKDREAIHLALRAAMLDQERPARVPWLDQRSGHGGIVAPVGSVVRQGEATCRTVLVSVQRGNDTSWVEGNACRAPGFEWSLADVRPFRTPS
jgi:surface antigen